MQPSENLFVWGLGLPAVVKKSTVLLLLVYTMLGISVRVDDSLRLMQGEYSKHDQIGRALTLNARLEPPKP